MKKLLLACSLIGAIGVANAQPMMHDHAPDPAAHAAQLQKTLQLSDEQTAKVKKLFEDNAQQRKALGEKYKPQFDAFHDNMKKLHDQTHTQLNSLLTPKQQQAFEAQRKAHGDGMCPADKDDDDGEHKHPHDHADKMLGK